MTCYRRDRDIDVLLALDPASFRQVLNQLDPQEFALLMTGSRSGELLRKYTRDVIAS